MKRILITLLVLCLTLGMAACGQKNAPAEAPAKLSGTVSTDGSTSMEKVIGALGEAFMEANSDVTFTYNPTGSGTGIQAVAEGRQLRHPASLRTGHPGGCASQRSLPGFLRLRHLPGCGQRHHSSRSSPRRLTGRDGKINCCLKVRT